MKIANIMLGIGRGGIEQAAVDYCIALAALGHEVLAITRIDAAINPALRNAGIPLVTIRAPQRWNLLARLRMTLALRGCDVAILHGNRAGEIVRPHRHRKTIAVAHSRFFTPHPYFDAVIALSTPRAEEIKRHYHGPIHIIPNMIDLPTTSTRAPWRTPPVIGSMGRLSHEKGFDLFIEALAILHQQNIPFHAIIGGEGPKTQALKSQATASGIAKHITWAGWVADKAAFFASIDIYCLPSRTENFPITLLEAMAYGCPSIATECGGGPAAMLTNDCGILTPITAEGIAQGLAQALSNPAHTAAMGQRARSRVEQNYATPVVAKQLNDAL